MLQETLQRTSGLEEAAPLVVCNEEHRFMVAEQLRQVELQAGALILEPQGRNTAPAVALAAMQALATDPEALLLVLPADHLIQDVAAFVAAVGKAVPLAEQGRLMTFGVVPTAPETGYGYIKCGAALEQTCTSWSALSKSPMRDRAGLSGERQLPVEQRHVPAAGRRLTWSSWLSMRRKFWPAASRRWPVPVVTWTLCARMRRLSISAPATASTMR